MPKKQSRTSANGIHENLKELANSGRVRFHGGWLNNSDQDRFLAEWINNTPEAWAVMKAILYQVLSGGGLNIQSQPTPDNEAKGNIGEAAATLLDFDD